MDDKMRFMLENEVDADWRLYQEALSSYAISRMERVPLVDRFHALNREYQLLREVVHRNTTFSRLMSLYRVVSDLGYRKQMDIVLGYLLRRLESCEPVSIAEPFLAASSCFDQRDPEQEMGKWCLASLLAS